MKPRACCIGVYLVAIASIVGINACSVSPGVLTPDVKKSVYLDTTGAIVNADSLRTELLKGAGPEKDFTRLGKCNGCIVYIKLRRLGQTNDIKAADGPNPARQLALIRNVDTDTTAMYDFEPGKDYVFQIGRGAGGAAVYAMIELPHGHAALRVVARGAVTGCPPHGGHAFSKVSFASCSDDAYSPTWYGASVFELRTVRAMVAGVATLIRSVLTEGPERRGWFSCDSGCCTA